RRPPASTPRAPASPGTAGTPTGDRAAQAVCAPGRRRARNGADRRPAPARGPAAAPRRNDERDRVGSPSPCGPASGRIGPGSASCAGGMPAWRPGTRQRPPWRTSVASDGGVDQQGPGLDAPDDVADVGEPLGHEMLAGSLAADPVVTVVDQRRVAGEVLDVV